MEYDVVLNLDANLLQETINNLGTYDLNDILELAEDVEFLLSKPKALEKANPGDYDAVMNCLNELNTKLVEYKAKKEVDIKEDNEEEAEERKYLIEKAQEILKLHQEFGNNVADNAPQGVVERESKQLLEAIEDFLQVYRLSDHKEMKKEFKGQFNQIWTFKRDLEQVINAEAFFGHEGVSSMKAALQMEARAIIKMANEMDLKNLKDDSTYDVNKLVELMERGQKMEDAYAYAAPKIYDELGPTGDSDILEDLAVARSFVKMARKLDFESNAMAHAQVREVELDAPKLVLKSINTGEHWSVFKDQLDEWASDAQIAINAVQGYMNSDEPGKEGGFTVDTLVSAIALIAPPQAQGFISFSKLTYDVISKEIKKHAPTNRLSFSELHSTWFKAFENFKNSKYEKEFAAFEKDFLNKYGEDYDSKDVYTELQNVAKKMSSQKQLQKAIVNAWIKSAVDGDDSDHVAGIIRVGFNIIAGAWKLSSVKPVIDDIEDPEGTINALTQTYGGNTLLIDLPFELHVTISNESFTGPDPAKGIRPTPIAGDTNFVYGSGDKGYWDAFIAQKPWVKMGRIKDLVPE